jgi:transposase
MAAKERRIPRARRQYTEEFRAGAVRLVLDEGKTLAEVARDLDLTPSALGRWVKRAQADRSGGKTGPTSDQLAEVAELKKALRVVTQERDILKKAVAFFAKENG